MLALSLLPLAACGGDDEKDAVDAGPCAAPDTGEFAPAPTYFDFTVGSFALQYELSDGATDCVVVDDAVTAGRYEIAGKDIQVYADFGDVDLGLVVDIASFGEEGDAEIALGEVPGDIGMQVDQHHFLPLVSSACTLTLAELADDSFGGSFTCEDVPGLADYAGPFGGETTDLSVVSARGWWRAAP